MFLIQLLYSWWNDFPFLYIRVVLHCKKISLYIVHIVYIIYTSSSKYVYIQAYLSTYLVYLFKLHKRWSLPCK